MPEEASMSFKVYLDLGGGKQEVRRFGLPETVATNYSVLKEKVCNIFGVSIQDCVLSWKDSEGDSITISSDDELMEAVADSLSNQNLQLVRINVTEGQSRSSSQPGPGPGPSTPLGNQQGAVHPRITCDGCNGRVQGFRYKCVSCDDFDLCGACEAKGLHKEHKMMRIPKPQDAGDPWFFWRERKDGPGQYSTHFGMHGKDGFSSSASFSGCGGAGGAGGGAGGGAWWGFGGPRGRFCHRRAHGGRGRGGWPGWWGRGWNGKHWAGQTMTSEGGIQQQQQSSSQQSQSQSSQQQSQQSQQQQSSGSYPREENCPWMSSEGAACPFSGEESEMPSPEQVAEEAKHMAEQMAQQAAQQAHHFASHYASDHLANVMRGIWTAWSGQQGQNPTSSTSSSSSSSHSFSQSASTSKDTSAEQDKSKEAEQNKETPQSAGEEYLRSVGEAVANMLDPLGIDVEVDVDHNGIRQRCSLGGNVAPSPRSNTSPAPTSPAKEPESSAASVASGGSVNMEVQTECPSGPQPSNKGEEAMDVSSPAPEESSQRSGEQLEGHSGSPEPEDWMLVNQETASEASNTSAADPKTQTPAAEKTVSYPSLAELTPHPDPKIQRALEHMLSMGYNNEGGWLTNLLEMKQGDINQVLDLLQPVTNWDPRNSNK